MTLEENNKLKDVIRERLRELRPENCEYCGGYHELFLSRDGMSISSTAKCCHDILREANKVIRETRKEFGGPAFQ